MLLRDAPRPHMIPCCHSCDRVQCDGGSRAGNAAAVDYQGHTLYFRGFKVLESMLHALLKPAAAAPSLSDAQHVLISGSSAGGLTTLLHADFIADAVHKASPNAVVKAVPEVSRLAAAGRTAGRHLRARGFEHSPGPPALLGGP